MLGKMVKNKDEKSEGQYIEQVSAMPLADLIIM